MAAQPKKKISRVRGRTRRAHLSVTLPQLVICPNCKHLKPPHIACPECGFYGAKKILITKTDKRIAKQLKEKPSAQKSQPSGKESEDQASQKTKKTKTQKAEKSQPDDKKEQNQK